MPAVALSPVGFFGKLPARGDFVRRRLPAGLVQRWHDWLQQGLAASREVLGAAWTDLYLTAPLWRFAMAGDAAGLWMPSIDQVGRHFPLLLAVPLPAEVAAAGFAAANTGWYDALEATALTALDAGRGLDEFDHAVASLPSPRPAAANPPGGGEWWTAGSPAVAACRHAAGGLPPSAGFAALLDGRWHEHGWPP